MTVEEPKLKRSKWPATILVGVLLLWIASGFVVALITPDWTVRGQIGDMFGAVNALFSGLALAGVVYAIFLQRQELELQRRELELNRQELRRTAEAQDKAQEALTRQVQLQVLSARLSAIAAMVAFLPQARGTNPWDVFARSPAGKRLERYVEELEELLELLRGQR